MLGYDISKEARLCTHDKDADGDGGDASDPGLFRQGPKTTKIGILLTFCWYASCLPSPFGVLGLGLRGTMFPNPTKLTKL